jgi:hypothetical protein
MKAVRGGVLWHRMTAQIFLYADLSSQSALMLASVINVEGYRLSSVSKTGRAPNFLGFSLLL